MMLWLVILIRVVANPAANVFQKLLTREGATPLGVICMSHVLLSAACLPILGVLGLGLVDIPGGDPEADGTAATLESFPRSFEFWWNIATCAGLAVACNTLLVYALRLGDLSLLGPINAYKSVVSLLPSLILLGEFPDVATLGGIALIVAGSVLIVGHDGGRGAGAEQRAPSRFDRLRIGARLAALVRSPGARYRIAALVVSATEAAFLKRAVLASTPITAFAWWSILGAAAAGAAWFFLRPATEGNEAPRQPTTPRITNQTAKLYVYLTIATGLMQYCTIKAIAEFEVGPLLALFQISTLLSVFFGYRYFAEPHFLRRLLGSAIMVAGAAVIVVCRQRS